MEFVDVSLFLPRSSQQIEDCRRVSLWGYCRILRVVSIDHMVRKIKRNLISSPLFDARILVLVLLSAIQDFLYRRVPMGSASSYASGV